MYNPRIAALVRVSARNAILRCLTSDQIKRLADNSRRVNYRSRNDMEHAIHDNWRALEPAIKAEFEIVWKRAE